MSSCSLANTRVSVQYVESESETCVVFFSGSLGKEMSKTFPDSTIGFDTANYASMCVRNNQGADRKRSEACLNDGWFLQIDPKFSNRARDALEQYKIYKSNETIRCSKLGVAEYDRSCCVTLDGTTLGEQGVGDKTALLCNNSWR